MALEAPEDPMDMPGAIILTLKGECRLNFRTCTKGSRMRTAGETVFYNSNILHCATYNFRSKRATLHATMGNASSEAGRERGKSRV